VQVEDTARSLNGQAFKSKSPGSGKAPMRKNCSPGGLQLWSSRLHRMDVAWI